jgi:drug/metabolite transporter (DMT)-like permease
MSPQPPSCCRSAFAVRQADAVEWNQTLTLTMAWSVLALSVGGIFLFLYLIRRGEVSRATAYIYLVPAVVRADGLRLLRRDADYGADSSAWR